MIVQLIILWIYFTLVGKYLACAHDMLMLHCAAVSFVCFGVWRVNFHLSEGNVCVSVCQTEYDVCPVCAGSSLTSYRHIFTSYLFGQRESREPRWFIISDHHILAQVLLPQVAEEDDKLLVSGRKYFPLHFLVSVCKWKLSSSFSLQYYSFPFVLPV